uniref:Uncharacterized protein n=1 Tax=Chlamydomonas euryale TaxID=1486919 RepID=A0A7R9Z697_9CHLO
MTIRTAVLSSRAASLQRPLTAHTALVGSGGGLQQRPLSARVELAGGRAALPRAPGQSTAAAAALLQMPCANLSLAFTGAVPARTSVAMPRGVHSPLDRTTRPWVPDVGGQGAARAAAAADSGQRADVAARSQLALAARTQELTRRASLAGRPMSSRERSVAYASQLRERTTERGATSMPAASAVLRDVYCAGAGGQAAGAGLGGD